MTVPTSKVFEIEHEGARTTIYADRHGLRVSCDAGELLVCDWYSWLLVSVYGIDHLDPRTGGFQAVALRAIKAWPPPPEDDDDH